MPILSGLLSIRFDNDANDHSFMRQEFFRITAIIYLGGLRRKFGVDLSLSVYMAKLRRLIDDLDLQSLDEVDPMLFWACLVSGLQSLGYPDHARFVTVLAAVVVRTGCQSWHEIVDITKKSSLWVPQAFVEESNRLRQELAAELWASYEVVFI